MSKGTGTEITICGRKIRIGDYVKVQYNSGELFNGASISGKIVELWDEGVLQARVENGWCFHDNDIIINHTSCMDVDK